ncbi:hypothetical protein [Emticicia sp. C21]|uniref:hypothetical protein n=1 Tax=Emticicia sp. C21 TaxID=2302915 RepID=UPI000E872AE8|nr:hypothetical protein [Emticicia sp. C21]RFS13931.1 hypothetical protein D0T08_23345 [Emticicia sp. C21]
MKKLLFILLSISHYAMAQSFTGDWSGNVQNVNGSLPAEMQLKVLTNNSVDGQLIVFANSAKDNYILKGSINATTAAGTLTYKDGTSFNFSMQLANGQIRQEISYNGQIILSGTFSKQNANTSVTNAPNADGLYRDPNLVGKWEIQENYSSSGGFYGGSSSVIVLNADGTIDDGGSGSYVSGPNSSGKSAGGGNQMIAEAKALGARWYTKDKTFYWRLLVNGKVTDVANSKYYIERGALLLTDLKTGKKQLYYKK